MAKNQIGIGVDSTEASTGVAEAGNLRFYLKILLTDPGLMLGGVRDSLVETFRFCFAPRFNVHMNMLQRLAFVARFIQAEICIPGLTTLLDTIWLTYIASQSKLKDQVWVEVGCFKGLSTARLSLVCKHHGGSFRVYDTFQGLPTSDDLYDTVDGLGSVRFLQGSYAGTMDEVKRNVAAYGASEIVSYHPGDVKDSLKDGIDATVGFAFLDVDLVESYRTCFTGLAPGIKPGSVIAIHEAFYKNVRELIESEKFWSELHLSQPQITYISDKYKQRYLRGVAMLVW